MKVYRDEDKNIDTLARPDLINLKFLDETFHAITGKYENEQDDSDIRKQPLKKMKPEKEVSEKEISLTDLFKMKKRGRALSKIGGDALNTKMIENIRNNILLWGDTVGLRWSREEYDQFVQKMKLQIANNNFKNFSFMEMKIFLQKRIDFVKNFFTEPAKKAGIIEALFRKYLGMFVKECREGDIFGERALESSAPRSASVVSDTNCE